jgi:DNA primase
LPQVKITQDVIEEIKSRLDIVDIASERVVLRKTGSNYKGLCPFHKEKTPSFTVNQDKQIYYCFGCHTGGDLISFVERTEGLSFYDAVVKLAELAGIKLKIKESSPEQQRAIDKKQELMNINVISRDYYVSNINIPGNAGLTYTKLRGLSEETMKKFSIGYASESWDGLSTMLSKKGVSLADAVSLGLIKENNGKYYDTFRGRVIFPIQDNRGATIAFGGRILEQKENAPKYLNSKESELYKKGEALYGLNTTGQDIRDAGFAIVVEGYMDLLSLYQAGIKNVVATLGTAFTERQVSLIKRYTGRIVLFYDSDEAGITAAKRSFEVLLQSGLNVDALFLENKMDPDDAVQKLGKDKLLERLKNAKPLMERLIADKFSEGSRIDKLSEVTRELLKYIAMVPDNVSRIFWLKELSLRTGLETRELNTLLSSYVKPINRQNPVEHNSLKQSISSKQYEKVDPLHRKIIMTMFFFPELSRIILEDEWEQYIPLEIKSMASNCLKLLEQRKELSISDWLYLAKDSGVNWFESMLSGEIINRKDNDGMNFEKEFYGCLVKFKMRALEKSRLDSLKRIREGQSSESTLREYKAIVQEINRLKPMLGNLE